MVQADRLREIVDYQNCINKATVNAAFSAVATTSSTYIVGLKVTITGDGRDDRICKRCVMLSSATVGNAVNKIVMINTGANYVSMQ